MFKNLSKYLSKICLCACTLIITSSIIGPKALAYAANVTIAWSSNSEPDLAGYYIYYKTGSSGAPYNGTGAVEGNSPIQVPLADFNNPAYPEYTIHGISNTETTYFVLTAYDTDGNESGYSNEASYHPPSVATLSNLSISGKNLVIENCSIGYTATATFSDGSIQTVTGSADWTKDSPFASINGSGLLTASEVSDDMAVTIHASYTVGDVTKAATKAVTIINVPPSNLPPDTPIIGYPENGQDEIHVPLEITTELFSDPNNDSHSQSQWQISDQSDFSSLVVDVISDIYLTTFSVPHMVLRSNQKYYVRVRFYDFYFVASDWSGPVEFTTTSFVEDLNSNGISDTEEVDDSVDFNLDGISDIYQPQIIKCVQASDGSNYIGIEKVSSSASEIEALEIIDPDTISDTVNRPADLIFGLFSYRLRVNQPGDTATLKIYFSGEIFSSDTIFKYDTINGWYDYSEHTTFNNDGQSVTLEVKDGGYGDSDGLANGVIVDPGGIAASEGDSYTVSGGSSGCFIATAAFGSKFEKHVRLLRRFRDFFLMPNRIGRTFVRAYYKYSPPMANFIAKHDSLRAMVRISLLPVVGISWIAVKLGPASTVALMLFFISCFLSLLWFIRSYKE
ncbi:MAG: hypothetical protein PVH36_06385 [Desulfobacterales bacterium]|jgi:hypothetical protein